MLIVIYVVACLVIFSGIGIMIYKPKKAVTYQDELIVVRKKNKNSFTEIIKRESKINNYALFRKYLFFPEKWEKLVKKIVILEKTKLPEEEKTYAIVFFTSAIMAFMLLVIFNKQIQTAVISGIFIYFICNMAFMFFMQTGYERYKRAINYESLSAMLQYGLYFPYYGNVLDVLTNVIIPLNKKREIGRQMEYLVNDIVTNQKTVEQGLREFKETIKGIQGFEMFVEHMVNTSMMGIRKEELKSLQENYNFVELKNFTEHVMINLKLQKEIKIKSSRGTLDLILILFFLFPLAALLFLPQLFDTQGGDVSIYDMILQIMKGSK